MCIRDRGAGGQRQHRNGEDVSGGAMQTAAFADGHGDGAGEQADGATEDVQNQERESHASARSFSTCDCYHGPKKPFSGILSKRFRSICNREPCSPQDVSSHDALRVCSRLITFIGGRAISEAANSGTELVPVSYTHLDVYKRQPL